MTVSGGCNHLGNILKIAAVFWFSHLFSVSLQAQTNGSARLIVRCDSVPLAGAIVQAFQSENKGRPNFYITDDAGKACCVSFTTLDSILLSHVSTGVVYVDPTELTQVGDEYVYNCQIFAYTTAPATVVERFSGIIIKGDTVRFVASKFADGRELDLKELVNRFPGLEVGADGVVRYQGKAVDRVVIDGRDVVRSQFDLLNSLVRPAEVTAADVITDRDNRGNTTTTFDVKTRNPRSLRAAVEAAVSARGQPTLSANALDTRNKIQGYASANLDFVGTNLGNGINLRESDDKVDRVVRHIARTATTEGIVRPTMLSVNSGRSGFAEANLVQKKEQQEIALYVSYKNSFGVGESSERLREATTGRDLGQNISQDQLNSERLKVNVRLQDSLSKRTYLLTWAQAELTPSITNTRGTSTIGGVSAATGFRHQENNRFARVGAQLVVSLQDNLLLEVFGGYTNTGVEDDFTIQDRVPIYGIMSNIGSLNYGVARSRANPMSDVRLLQQRGPHSFGGGLQFAQQRLREGTATDALDSLAGNDGGRQFITSGTVYAQYQLKDEKREIFGETGVQLYEYGRQEIKHERLAPLAHIKYVLKLPKNFRLTASGRIQTKPFDENLLWMTAMPVSPRQLNLGYLAVAPLASSYSASLGLARYSNTGTLVMCSLSAGQREKSLSPVLTHTGGYVAYEPALFSNLFSANGLLLLKHRIAKQSLSGEVDYKLSSSEFADALVGTSYSAVDLQSRASITSFWSHLLQTSAGIILSQHHQTVNRNGEEVDIELLTLIPRLGFKLRGKSLNFSTEGSWLVRANASPVPVLNGSLTYRKPQQPLYLTLSGNDLLRYAGSSFTRLDVGTAVATEVDYARLRGFVTLKAGYNFDPKRAQE